MIRNNILSLILFLIVSVPLSAQEFSRLGDEEKTNSLEVIRERSKQVFTEGNKGKGSGYKQYQRWEHNQMNRLDQNKNLTNATAQAWNAYYNLMSSNTAKSASSNHGFWQEISAGSYSVPNESYPNAGYNGGVGRVNCLAQHPTNSNILFAGSPAGGLWKTTSGGFGWECLTDGMPQIGISAIVIDYNNPNTMYIATGDGDGYDTQGIGILKSLDGGISWNTTGMSWGITERQYSNKLMMHPDDPSILVLTTHEGTYITYDSAVTWDQIITFRCFDIEFHPTDSDVLFISSNRTYRRLEVNLAGEYEEVDAFQFTTATGSKTRTELAVCPSNPDRIYALVGNRDSGLVGLFRSDNKGDNWINTNSSAPNILNTWKVPLATKSQAPYDLSLVCSNSNSTQVLSGGVNIWKTTNSGSSWNITSYWESEDVNNDPNIDYVHADIHNLYNLNGVIFACTDGGIFKSSDFGTTWTDISFGLGISQWYRIDIQESNPGIVVGGCQDIGTNRLNNSSTLEHILGGDGMGAVYDQNNSGHVFITRQNGSLFESNNHGFNNADLTVPGGGGLFVTDFLVDPTDGDKIFYGGLNDAYRRTAGAFGSFLWIDLDCGIDSLVAMGQGINNSNRLYAASFNGIRRTSEAHSNSPTWTNIEAGLPFDSAFLSNLTVDPNDSNDIWVTFSGFSDGDKVFYSFDGGDTWSNKSTNLPNVPIYCVEFDPNTNQVYIGTHIGIFYYDNNDNDWTYFSNGLPTVPVYDLNIIESDEKLVAATYGRGIWMSNIYTSCPSSYSLNPSNDPSNENFTGFQIYEATSTILSTREIVGGPGSEVIYQAGSFVQLTPGFSVSEGCEFNAKIGSCDGDDIPTTTPQTQAQGSIQKNSSNTNTIIKKPTK